MTNTATCTLCSKKRTFMQCHLKEKTIPGTYIIANFYDHYFSYAEYFNLIEFSIMAG